MTVKRRTSFGTTPCGCICAAGTSSMSLNCTSVLSHMFWMLSRTCPLVNGFCPVSCQARQKMLVSPPSPTTQQRPDMTLRTSQAGGRPTASLSSDESARACLSVTGLGDGHVLKERPWIFSTSSALATLDPMHAIHASGPSTVSPVIWNEPPPESHAMSSAGVSSGTACTAVSQPSDDSDSCETMRMRMESSDSILRRNSGPFLAFRNAAVATPANCSAPAFSALDLSALRTASSSSSM
mmetsp:Transcript_57099/g.150488  ORF Transcript_57099/g.150488 Transcript_57099/m.150488 type:complete len:239 (-) Transcript_57099:382-1098(-)